MTSEELPDASTPSEELPDASTPSEELLDRPAELDVLGGDPHRIADGIAMARAHRAVQAIFTFDDVDNALFCSVLRYPYLQVLAAGQQAASAEFTMQRRVAGTSQGFFVDGAKASALFEKGNTLVFNALEEWHLPSQQLARELARRAGARVQVTAFCTPAGHTGFARHRDDVHVYAVQTVGSKVWRLSSPAPADGFEPGLSDAAGAELSVTTEQGAVLWMHRGVRHSATASEQASVHVSFTIRRPSLADLIRDQLAGQLRALENRHAAADPVLAHRQLRQAAQAVQSALCDADWPTRLGAAAAASIAGMPGRPAGRSSEIEEPHRDG